MVDDLNPNGRVRLDAAGLTMLRVRRFAKFRIRPALYRDAQPATVDAWEVRGEPVPFDAAVERRYRPFQIGERWGRPWDTVWFHVRGDVPSHWNREDAELVVDLGFTGDQPGFQAEATAYRPDGSVIKGIEPLNAWLPLPGTGAFEVFLEAAANPVVQVPYEYEPTHVGDKATAGDDLQYQLRRLDVARRDGEVWELLQDVEALDGLVDVLSAESARRAEIVHALNRMVDVMDPDDVAGTTVAGREALASVLARPATQSSLVVSAVGHAHIDCAWLWPTRETVRKVARTFANVLDLAERNPDFVFAASSAQQFAWLRDSQPELFERVRAAVAAGTIRPVGGMWVESDTNMPGGEALVRQFVLGKRFFLEEFGVESDEVWLPDSFGYSAGLPQIMRAAGARYFLTQKPSWNEVNRMPNSSFLWEGLDGSRVFTHFPPAETYNSDLGAADLDRSERSFVEKGSAQNVLGLYGWGDGGGGPTREMLGAAMRKRDLDGSPRVRLSDPHSFFVAAEAELDKPSVWSGEMYLELHRGTLISQQKAKRGNRRSEAALREAELWAATAAITRGTPYPYDELERLWQTVLLLQFHDILPGSSIAWVHHEAERDYDRVLEDLDRLTVATLDALAGEGNVELRTNASPFERDGVPGFGIAPGVPAPIAAPQGVGDGYVLEDEHLRVEIDSRGALTSAFDLDAERELVPDGLAAGVLQLFRDTPREWDAWDINEEDQRSGRELLAPASIAADDESVAIRHELGRSTIKVTVRLVDGRLRYDFDIDWHESQKLLKLAFPLDLKSDRAASEVQFGHIERPTHRNTSWDAARFETVAHRWIHVGEPDYGVAIANHVVYGHDIRSEQAPSGRPMTVARLSLLRAPTYPDPAADQGRHQFSVSLRPGDVGQAVEDGYAQHHQPRTLTGSAVASLISLDTSAVIAETVKLAEDRSGDLVIRLYESLGTRARATLSTHFGSDGVEATDLLERRAEQQAALLDVMEDGVRIELRPFQMITLRFRGPRAVL